MAESRAARHAEVLLFLAYGPIDESKAQDAGCTYVGASWDARGVKVKIYKPRADALKIYVCRQCSRSQTGIEAGMYCCGHKRVLQE
ncbi:MAG: hypothetical protein V4508_09330 [Pseudomonadota bacterium]